jgi:transketolase N-terminal domain/subunit
MEGQTDMEIGMTKCMSAFQNSCERVLSFKENIYKYGLTEIIIIYYFVLLIVQRRIKRVQHIDEYVILISGHACSLHYLNVYFFVLICQEAVSFLVKSVTSLETHSAYSLIVTISVPNSNRSY